MTEVEKFYKSFSQEIVSRQLASEDGDTQEQAFTRYVTEMLSDAGETENVDVAYDEKDLGTKKQHKINGYAIADNYETIDLFISVYKRAENIENIPKAEVDRAVTRITNFFRKAVYDDYYNDVAESSQIYTFAHTLANYDELRNSLIRINVFVLVNGEYKGELPKPIEVSGYKIFYRVLDVNYFYQISEQSRIPIEIDFEENGYHVPCLEANINNSDYQAYIAVIPGTCLADLYERFGTRLLEQNVRSFLQFSGKINKGMRTTIQKEPHMFLAFNNGISATADSIVLDDNKQYIKKITNLQIVNGGQTTASIYHAHKGKEKTDISNIFVQVKFSVIKRMEEYSDIVSRISQYANTQNKVNGADFTANNPSLVAFEKMSRFVLAPVTVKSTIPTAWFFERVRGQYKNLRQKEGFTKARLKAFEMKNPSKQVFTKVDLAKYINAYQEVYDGKSLVIGPHKVVKGNEKNYDAFVKDNLPDHKKVTNVYFEDAIAKAILFREADLRYGTKRSGNNIGELKQVVVPYTISLLNIISGDRLDLYKIWKNQCISDNLSEFIYKLMLQVNAFILKKSPVTHYIEWAKKEECWEKVKSAEWNYDLLDIADDLINKHNPPQRKVFYGVNEEGDDVEHEMGIIKSIPPSLWKKIGEWGQDTDFLSINYQNAADEIARKLKYDRKISDSDRKRAIAIFEIVCKNNIELLSEADEIAAQEKEQVIQQQNIVAQNYNEDDEMNIELIKKMVEWDRRKRILKDWQWQVMFDVANGKKQLTEQFKRGFLMNLKKLQSKGFNPEE